MESKETALHVASRYDSQRVTQLLLKNGADVEASNVW